VRAAFAAAARAAEKALAARAEDTKKALHAAEMVEAAIGPADKGFSASRCAAREALKDARAVALRAAAEERAAFLVARNAKAAAAAAERAAAKAA
jgi:hypothetical protein